MKYIAVYIQRSKAKLSITLLTGPSGIFGYLNYLVPRTRQHILETLVKGLFRLEYRGYDSAGVAFDDGGQLATTNGSPLQKIRSEEGNSSMIL